MLGVSKCLTRAGTTTVKPTITFVGSSTNIAGTNQNVVVGQEILLTGTPTGGTWTQITGNIVAGFTAGASGGPLTLVSKNQSSVLFYWVTGGTQTVTYTVSGASANVTFTVAAPSFGGIATSVSSVYLTPSWMELGDYPSPPPGIKFVASITPPSGYSGTLAWGQIINSLVENFELSTGKYQDCTAAGLDNSWPYMNSIPPTQTSASTNDNPGIGLPSVNYLYVYRSDSFSMYLMWQPSLSNSIQVPLGVVNWSWNAAASFSTSTSQWSLGGYTVPSPSVSATSTYPSWAQTVAPGGTLCGEPYDAQNLEAATRRGLDSRRSSQ